MDHITVPLKAGDGLVPVPFADILFVEYSTREKGVLIHTLNLEGFLPGSFNFWVTVLQTSGMHNLMFVDRNNALNLDNVRCINVRHKTAYFETQMRKDKGCTISIPNYKPVLERLEQLGHLVAMV